MFYEAEYTLGVCRLNEVAELAGEAVQAYLESEKVQLEDGAQVDIEIRRLTDRELFEEAAGTGWNEAERREWGEDIRKVVLRVSRPMFKRRYEGPVTLDSLEVNR